MRTMGIQSGLIGTSSFITIYLAGALTCSAQSVAIPEPPGWFTGDAHVHRGICCGRSNATEMLTPHEVFQGMMENNLAVVSILADIGNGECKYAARDIPLIDGKDNPASTPEHILHWGGEWHWDPRGVTFEKKVIGGHLIVLGLQQGKTIFSEYTYPVFEWARKQGAVVGFAHMQYLTDDVPNQLDCCKPLEFPVETALGTSSFLMEDVNGSEPAIHAYYRILNCGFRPGLVASTDFPCNFLQPYGTLLTYVHVKDEKLTYRKWIEGIAQGHTVISRNGHNEFLDLKVNGLRGPGDEVRLSAKGKVRVNVRWSALKNLSGRIELVRNGAVVAAREGSASPDSPLVFNATVDFAESGWLCARRMDAKGHQSHTGAVFVLVHGAPIRASADDAEYFVRWIDNLIQQTSPGGEWNQYFSKQLDAAQSRYRRARTIFKRIASEARTRAQTQAKEARTGPDHFHDDSRLLDGAEVKLHGFRQMDGRPNSRPVGN